MEVRYLSVRNKHSLSPDFAYLVIKPDCVRRGLVHILLGELAHENFEVLAFRIGRVPMSLLFQSHGAAGRLEVDDWRFNARLHEFGPSVSLLLRRRAGAKRGTAHAHLRALKGGALPSNFGSGTLRSRVGALNRVCNLLHCPDTPLEIVRDLEAWMPRVEAQVTGTAVTATSVIEEIERHGYHETCFDPAALVKPLRERLRHATTWRSLNRALMTRAEAIFKGVAAGQPLGMGAHAYLLGLLEDAGVYISAEESYVLEIAQRYPASNSPLDR